MRRACLLVSLWVLACSSGSGRTIHPDAGSPGVPAADATGLEDPDTATAPDLAMAADQVIAPDSTIAPDTMPVVPDALVPPHDAQQAPDLLPDSLAIVDSSPAREAGRETTPDTVKLSFPSCTFGGQTVEVAKYGTNCGRYPQLGPNGTISCYVGCTVETTWTCAPDCKTMTAPVGAKPDTTTQGYCSANIDDFAISGSKTTRLGLCFADDAACSSVCQK